MLRDEWNKRYGEGNDPIIINSAYRSWEVNKKAGGSATSNHLVGCAADIRCLGKEQALRYAVILLDIADDSKEDFDELIIEVRGSTVSSYGRCIRYSRRQLVRTPSSSQRN